MDRKLINPAIVQDIAAAIREKGGQTEPIVVNALGDAIRALPQGMGDNTTEVVEAISGEQPEGDIAIANAIAKGATDAAREHVWQGERATDEGRELRDGVAFVSSLKGRSFKVSQNTKNGNFERGIYAWNGAGSCTIAVDENGLKATLSIDATSSYTGYVTAASFGAIQGHKYLVIVSVTCDKSGSFLCDTNGVIATSVKPVTANVRTIVHAIGTCASSQIKALALYPSEKINGYKAGDSFTIHYAMYFDLTAMGMEDVVDADDFAHRLGYADAASMPYIPYGEQIINSKPTEVVSRGRNLWDEEWEEGTYYLTNGMPQPYAAYFRTKNRIPVVGGRTIRTTKAVYIFKYDENDSYIGYVNSAGGCFLEDNVRYIRFVDVTRNTYGGDICVNYSDAFDGNYYPYLHSVLPLPLSTILHEGQPLFPNGLCGIGDVKDEVDWMHGKAVKRIGSVDAGSVTWYSNGAYFAATIPTANSAKIPHCLLLGYATSQGTTWDDVKEGMVGAFASYVRVRDSSFSDASSFRESIRGRDLLYELATPIEVTLDPAKAFYRVQNGGSEEAVMDGVSAPLVADIAYRDNMAYAEEAALLAFANERSGQNDADLGDAIRTLSE